MILVIEEEEGELIKVRKSLATHETVHETLLRAEPPNAAFSKLQSLIESCKQDLLCFKKEKLRRVIEYYSNCCVYRWSSGEWDPIQYSDCPWRTTRKLVKPLNTINNSLGDSDGDKLPVTMSQNNTSGTDEVIIREPMPFLEDPPHTSDTLL